MYKWMKAYLNEFGTDFPFSEVADLNEYEICRIIQYCVEHHAVYDGGSEDDDGGEGASSAVGTAVVGTAMAG